MIEFNIYIALIIVKTTLLLYFGLHLLIKSVPERLKNSVFDTVRKLISAAFLIVAINTIGFPLMDFGHIAPKYNITFNLSCYYIVSWIFALSFTYLISKKSNYRHPKLKWIVLSWFIYPIPMLATINFNIEPEVINIIQIISATLLFATVIGQTLYVFTRYKNAVRQGENYYSEDINININWIVKSMYLIVSIGILSCLIAFAIYTSKLIITIYFILVTGVFVYIFESLVTFMITFYKIVLDNKEEQTILIPEIEERATLPQNIISTLDQNIERWVEQKGYCRQKITIQTIALELNTNRAYLSNYINTRYQCTFKTWVSKLRIEEAKILLSDKDNRGTITTVAEIVGFISLTSFTHSFKNIVGIPPKRWLEELDEEKEDSQELS